jgi:hypothetical protein
VRGGRRPDIGRIAVARMLVLLGVVGLAAHADGGARVIVDAHLNYTGVDAAALPPSEIIDILDRNGIQAAVVSGMPAWPVERLYEAAPTRILPFLGVYRGADDKRHWMHDPALPRWVETQLDTGIYRGIGELHLFAPDRHSPVLAALVDLARDRGLVLQVHGDTEVIDAIFARAPSVTVLWAHLGTDPRPTELAPVLARHPRLYVDTSVRDERFVDEQGRLLPHWYRFFVEHADRVLVGVDTYWTRRWRQFDAEVAQIRAWLDQLPPDVADRIAHGNARRLFELQDTD